MLPPDPIAPAPRPSRPLLFLAGPTAVGKTEASLLLAERLDGEIVTVDSMQVYRGLDIGTAKPTPEERRGIPHHLLDVVDVNEPFDAAAFVRLARETVEAIERRGKLPIFCGGSGLYFKAYHEGLGESPASDPALRAELERMPNEELLAYLAAHDPVTYDRIDRQNPRRVVRAVEVIRLTGRPFSAQRAAWRPPGEIRAAVYCCLTRDREELCCRIAARVEEQFDRGVIAETEVAMKRGLAENRTAMQAIVYRQVVEYLQGVRNLEETKELIKARNRKYSKRQVTWFKHQTQCTWFHLAPHETADSAAERVRQAYLEQAKSLVH